MIDEERGVCLVDLMSKAGTKLITLQEISNDKKKEDDKETEEEKKETKLEVFQTLDPCLPISVKNG